MRLIKLLDDTWINPDAICSVQYRSPLMVGLPNYAETYSVTIKLTDGTAFNLTGSAAKDVVRAISNEIGLPTG